MDLNDGIAFELTEVPHLFGHDCIGAGRQGLESSLVELLPVPSIKVPWIGEVLIGGVPVWGHPGSVPRTGMVKGEPSFLGSPSMTAI